MMVFGELALSSSRRFFGKTTVSRKLLDFVCPQGQGSILQGLSILMDKNRRGRFSQKSEVTIQIRVLSQ
jgi:hypothetical protein